MGNRCGSGQHNWLFNVFLVMMNLVKNSNKCRWHAVLRILALAVFNIVCFTIAFSFERGSVMNILFGTASALALGTGILLANK
jgi:hypothetical protein